MEIKAPDKVQISITADGCLLIRSVDCDSGEKNFIRLVPYQVRLISEFIERNTVFMHSTFESSHDFSDVQTVIEICPSLQRLTGES